jgi:hypothetical protein
MFEFLDKVYGDAEDKVRNRPNYRLSMVVPKFQSAEMRGLHKRLSEAMTELNRLLSQHRFYPQVLHMAYYGDHLHHFWRTAGAERSWEEHLIDTLFKNRGYDLYLIRRCTECSDWFYAVTERQTYCSGRCRQKHSSTSERFKSRRREYMRRYRVTQREFDEDAKKLARKGARRQMASLGGETK